MNEEYRKALAVFVAGFHLPRYRELPDLGLHLEQITRYVNRFTPSPLTPSMVSNYVKQKLIPGPTKKSYDRDAISYLIFVSYIKTVMSLDDIRLMINVQQGSYDLATAYDYFCDEFENLLQYVCGLKEAPDVIGVTASDEKELLRTALFSITYKVYMDQFLKLFHPPAP